MNLLGKILHVGISVCNMEQSLRWYEKNLGFHIVKDDGYVPPLRAKVCFMERDGFQIELFEYEQPIAIPEERLMPNTDLQTVGTKHVAFSAHNLDALKAELVANGVDLAHEVNMGDDHVLFIRDCNGVLIELIECRG